MTIKVTFATRLGIIPSDILSVSLRQEGHHARLSRRSVSHLAKQKKAARVTDKNRRSGDHDGVFIAVITLRATEQTSSVPARTATAVTVDNPIQFAFQGLPLQASYTGNPAPAGTACTNSPIQF